jgi:hypothetical protein
MKPYEEKTAEQCPTSKEKKKWTYRKIFWTLFGVVNCWTKLQSLYDKYGKMVLSFFGFDSE